MSTNKKQYTGLTIGPIVDTLAKGHKLREIWLASFMFSQFMQLVIEYLNTYLFKNKDVFEYVLPYPDKIKLIEGLGLKHYNTLKAGVFPDRIILQSDDGMKAILQDAVDHAHKEQAKDMSTVLGLQFEECHTYLIKYLNTPIIEGKYSPRKLTDKKGKPIADNVIFYMNHHLANTELHYPYIAEDENLILDYLLQARNSPLYKAVEANSTIPSIEEIASRGNTPDNAIADKYICVVQADGDNIGNLIGEIYSEGESQIQNFAKALSIFSYKATDLIQDHHGFPVYAGGDDLLFFHPVRYDDRSVFTLIYELDKLFDECMNENEEIAAIIEGLSSKPSMSYGLSITYIKHPMHEALETANELLFQKAKKIKGKNCIAYRIMKHSGQTLNGYIHKSDTHKDKILNILKPNTGLAFNSVMHNLESQKVIIETLFNAHQSGKSDSDLKKRLIEFFTNNYNEQKHITQPKFFEEVSDLLIQSYQGSTKNDKVIQDVKTNLYLSKFINQQEDV